MESTLGDLTPTQESLFLTLYLRALDNRRGDPILGDTTATELVEKIDYDYSGLKVQNSLVLDLAVRTKHLDQLVQAFTAKHPDAVVLDLGAGLDSRARRCRPPTGVDWYDIDFPVVADLRKQYLPNDSHIIGSDLTSPGWLDSVPRDRPTMIVADGLMAFMSGEEFTSMTRTLTTHLASGEFASNAYPPLVMKVAGYSSTFRSLGATAKGDGIGDPREAERWGAGLTLIDEYLLARAPEIARYPQPLRGFTRLCAHSVAICRIGNRLVHYRF